MASPVITGIVDSFSGQIQKHFQADVRVLSFGDFLAHFMEQPYRFARNSAAYAVDMMDHFGRYSVPTPTGAVERFKVFDMPFDPRTSVPLVGQEEAQQALYRMIHSFLGEGQINKLILLHGPNGSSKSSLFRCIVSGLEQYSRTIEGALYSFNWIFPIESVYKKSIGLGSAREFVEGGQESYAHLDAEKISTVIPNEMRDNPILLLPLEQRREFLSQCGERLRGTERERFDLLTKSLLRSDLSAKSKQIFEALLTSYKGDFRKVLMHIQVERIYFSKRFQCGVVTVDPQMNVDAAARQVTMNRSLSYIPPALQNLTLYELDGDLVHANRGMIEFNDLLKRPVEAFKYLLGTCETGIVNVGPTLAYLDEVMVGTCNEVQMDAFREYPDFSSFQARMDFIRLPYLLRYSQEQRIYNEVISGYAGSKHINPHTTESLAIWAVLTRLRKPTLDGSTATLKRVVEGLSAYEKAKLYDTGEMPSRLTTDEAKELRAHLKELWEEFHTSQAYEGRFGASAREMKNLLHKTAQLVDVTCVSPGQVFEELEDFVQRKNDYEFLRMEPTAGYHAHDDFVEIARDHYLSKADRHFKEALGLVEESQIPQMLARYATHLAALMRREKVLNEVTGQFEEPDQHMINRAEDMMGISKDREQFRRDVITNIAAWAHDHQGDKLDYTAIFPDFIQRIKNFYHEEHRKVVVRHLRLMLNQEEMRSTSKDLDTKLIQRSEQALRSMIDRHGYCESCAKEAASLLLKHRYAVN